MYRLYITIFTHHKMPDQPAPYPLLPPVYLLTLARGGEFPSTSLVCWQLPHPYQFSHHFTPNPQIKLQCLHRQHQQHQLSSSGTMLHVEIIWMFAVVVLGHVEMNSAGAGTVLDHEEITLTVCCRVQGIVKMNSAVCRSNTGPWGNYFNSLL